MCSGALAPIVNSAYQGNYSPMKRFGFGGFGGHENYAGNVSIFFFFFCSEVTLTTTNFLSVM